MDDEYVQNGVANIFLKIEALGGKRQVKIIGRRTQIEWTEFINKMLAGLLELIKNNPRKNLSIEKNYAEGRDKCT